MFYKLKSIMTKHIYLGFNIRIRLINNLKSLLEYCEESYSNSELLSYSNKELKQLIKKYSIKLENVDNPFNSWYTNRVAWEPYAITSRDFAHNVGAKDFRKKNLKNIYIF